MKIIKATRDYESWLSGIIPLDAGELGRKHEAMSADAFSFLRATYYRWIQVWPEACEDAAGAPKVLAVGDLHVENFGTWRDSEGRLAWGVNDFDEAARLPYTNDLVRLSVSVLIATVGNKLKIPGADACAVLLDGYRSSLEAGGDAFVLAEQHDWLRRMAINELRDPGPFWNKLTSCPVAKNVPERIDRALRSRLPGRGMKPRILHRVAGLGSLGRQRFVAVAEWQGGLVAREAKHLAPPASVWASDKESSEIFYNQLLDSAVRCADPFTREERAWGFRRLAPDCSRIELSTLARERDLTRMIYAMGWETANVHLGSRRAAPTILDDLKKRGKRWLREATDAMHKSVLADWEAWRQQ